MNSTKNYSISGIKKRVPMIISLIVLAGMIALNVCVKEPVLEPDTVHPFANARVSWEQTFHAGSWGDGK